MGPASPDSPPASTPRGPLGLAALAAVAVAAALPLEELTRALLLALLAVLWLLSRPSRRQRWIGGLGLTAVVLLSAAAGVLEKRPADDDAWRDAVEEAYVRLCEDLLGSAQSTAEALSKMRRAWHEDGEAPAADRQRLEIFGYLQNLTETPAFRDRTLIYFDPDGEAVAWAGNGLLHESDSFDLPTAGLAYRRGYTALTLMALAPLSEKKRPYRILVGQSFPTTGLPLLGTGKEDFVWSLTTAGGTGADEAVRIAPEGLPALVIARRPRPQGEGSSALRWSAAWWAPKMSLAAAFLLGLTLITLGFLRARDSGASSTLLGSPALKSMVLLTTAGMALWGRVAGLEAPLTIALAASAGLALWGLLRRRPESVQDGGGELLGGLALVVLTALAWVCQQRLECPDLAAGLWLAGGEEVDGGDGVVSWALRLTMCLAALGLLTLAGRHRGPARGDGAGWIAMLLLLLAAAVHDSPLAGLALAAVGAGAAARWLTSLDLRRRPMALGGVLLLAAASGAVAWEIAYREAFRQRLANEFLPQVAPPRREEVNDLHLEIHQHFDGLELTQVTPPAHPWPADGAEERELDSQDLAFVLWRDSPLAARDGASALIIRLADGTRSSFSFGLSLNRDLQVDPDPENWPVPPVKAWRDAVIWGEAELAPGGRAQGVAEYWFLPRPGFRLEVNEVAELEAALVRGAPRLKNIDGLPRPALYSLYDSDGRAISSAWEESPPLAREIHEKPHGVTTTPSGRSWYWSAERGELLDVLYLPRFSPWAALERVGTHTLGALVIVAALLLWVLVVALPIGGLRGLAERTIYSYSKRLLLVYASLLLVPLAALNLILLQGFEDRLRRDQQAQGQKALGSARLVLVDYLKGLEPGFSIDTRINRELLEWLSNVARHQVNLYWGSEVLRSSQWELFTAGLLPKRIPGDVFSRLALLGHEVGDRTQHTGDVAYLELYTPLELGGDSPPGLFLSVPLLAQEEEVARELAKLRRRAILVTSALVFLLLAVGSRLAASFTKPIMQLIEGTQQIAGGATFLGVTPRERELSSLADAIDEMARRIAAGRRQLVLEKQVVERMVENITSGVVSLDHERRVLMHNRVAAELLGAEAGALIDRALDDDDHLEPVAEFLATAAAGGGEIASATVQLADEDGEMREWTLTWVPVPGPEDPSALLVVDDDTEVLRGQRLEAWAEMARIIAHEIKNPLTPIRLSAEHLQQVYQTDRERLDEIFERCTRNILKQVEELRDIASDFSIYSHIPRAELVAGDLVASMRELMDAYRDTAENVELAFESPLDELHTRFDAKLLGRAVRNLLENALRASTGAAQLSADGDSPQVLLSVAQSDSRAVISVLDSGPGVDPESLKRIFEPYFSTHETGTGLGLAISQRIVDEHGGRLEARNRPGGGLAVTITIPLSETA